MKKPIAKLKNLVKSNKILNFSIKTVSALLTVIVFGLVSIVVVQRVTNNRVNLAGLGIYTVATGSMVPEYNPRDLLLAKRVPASEINIGDDVVYLGVKDSTNGKIITHRVINKSWEDGKYYFYTRGIANSITDPEIEETQILGVVKTKLHILSFCSQLVNNSYGFMFVIFIPFSVFVFFEGKHIVEEMKEDKTKG